MYLDTALLAKQYLKEPDAEAARKFLAQARHRPSCSELGRMELAATFHRKLREGEITQTQLGFLRFQFEQDIFEERIHWLPLTKDIIDTVERIFSKLPANIFLRAGDAIHLATAAEAGFKEIYSNDRHLLKAASVFKLKGTNPLAK